MKPSITSTASITFTAAECRWMAPTITVARLEGAEYSVNSGTNDAHYTPGCLYS